MCYPKSVVLKFLFKITSIITLSLIIASCGNVFKGKSEGIIEYEVSYPKMEEDNFMLDFMPTTMLLKFKDDNYITDLSAGMGMFKTNYMVKSDQREFIQLVKLINKKYACVLNEEAIYKSLAKQPKYKIEFTNNTKKILKFKCKEAIVTVDNEDKDQFKVYYTDKINIEDPNWCTSFAPIKGVMLEYQYEKYNVHMKLTATNVEFTDVLDEEFNIPEEYEHLSEKEIDYEMNEIFKSFE